MIRDRKEVFQDFYDEATEVEGLTGEKAEQYALDRTTDYFANLADWARDRAKEG